MAPKKKGKKGGDKKKGKKAPEEEDLSTEKLIPRYKKKCVEIGVSYNRNFVEMLQDKLEEQEHLTEFHMNEELGWNGAKGITDALREIVPDSGIKLWKCFLGDEGVRSLCQYLEINKSCTSLDLLDNKITPLGCEFIGKILTPGVNSPIQILRLDHNDLLAEGVQNLAVGLSLNSTITHLYLSYCKIPALGARGLFESLIFVNSVIEELDLQGNFLKGDGIVELCRGLILAPKLKTLNISDNQFGQENIVLNAIGGVWRANHNVKVWDMRYNGIFSEGCKKWNDEFLKGSGVSELLLNEHIPSDILAMIETTLKDNKPKKKGKGKGKKGKKGKKKKK